MPESNTVTIQARHQFTKDELIEHATNAAQISLSISRLEDELSSIKKDYGAKILKMETDRGLEEEKVRNQFEMRSTRAIVAFNKPTAGRKSFYHATITAASSNEQVEAAFIRDEAMDATDFQRDLPLDEGAHPHPAEAERFPGQFCAHGIAVCDECEECTDEAMRFNGLDENEPVDPERFPETGDSAAEVRKAREVIADAAQPIGTPVGAALDQAAVQTKAPQFSIKRLTDPDFGWTVVTLMKAVRLATKAAGWTEAQRSTLNDALKKASGVNAMVDFLRPFVIAEDARTLTVDPDLVQAGNFEVIRLDCALSDPTQFPLEKITQEFRIAAVRAEWPADAINAVVNEAERQARVIGDEPEATQQATKYLRSFCVSKEASE